MVDLVNELRPEPSPWRDVFKDRIPQNVLAYHCRMSPGRMNQILNGFSPMPRYVEERFSAIKRELEKYSEVGVE
jgi:hypothetical protein